jgi:hypothetical protein
LPNSFHVLFGVAGAAAEVVVAVVVEAFMVVSFREMRKKPILE